MVLLTTTLNIHNTFSALPNSLLSALPSLTNSTPPAVGSPIDHDALVALARLSKSPSSQITAYSLSSLLRGTSVYAPPPTACPQPSPEYLALKQRLLAQQEQRQYATLVNKHSTTDEEDDADSQKDDITPSLVSNILLSILLCAGATFYITRFWSNDGLRVLVSMFVGIVVGVAEVTVYARYLRKVEQSRVKERKKREIKTVLGNFNGEGEDGITKINGNTEYEERIWGRGVNGGVRRRVREKWEKEQAKNER